MYRQWPALFIGRSLPPRNNSHFGVRVTRPMHTRTDIYTRRGRRRKLNFSRESIRRIFVSKTRGPSKFQYKNLSVEIIKLLREILSYQLVSISFFYTIIREFEFYTGIMIYIDTCLYISLFIQNSIQIVRTYTWRSIWIVIKIFCSESEFLNFPRRKGKVRNNVISIKTGREAISEGKHRCEESQRPNVGMGP